MVARASAGTCIKLQMGSSKSRVAAQRARESSPNTQKMVLTALATSRPRRAP